MKVWIRTPFAFTALIGALAVGACSDDDPAGPNGEDPPLEVTVQMGDNVFTPLEVTVKAGGTVTWVNAGDRDHTTTSDDWDSGRMETSDTFERPFPTADTFEYVCSFHPDMTGRVVVK